MKKLLLSVALLASSFTLLAQSSEITYGAKGGLNVSNFIGDDADDSDSKVGFNVGLFLEAPIAERLSIQPELLFSTQGAESESGDGSSEAKLSYISIPVMFKYYVTEKFNLLAGPQLSFNINSEFEALGITVDADDLGLDTSTVDFGLNFGLGYNITEKFFVEGRYNIGINDVYDDIDVKNSVFQFGLGYRF